MDTDLLTAEQVARLTGVTESYIRRLARTGQLDAVRLESGKWLIPASATDRVRRRAVPTDQAADGWQVERDLLYAERAELLLRTRDLGLAAARSNIDRLRADNDRLRQVVAQLSATVATMAAPDLPVIDAPLARRCEASRNARPTTCAVGSTTFGRCSGRRFDALFVHGARPVDYCPPVSRPHARWAE